MANHQGIIQLAFSVSPTRIIRIIHNYKTPSAVAFLPEKIKIFEMIDRSIYIQHTNGTIARAPAFNIVTWCSDPINPEAPRAGR
jgi:hypothetical protein